VYAGGKGTEYRPPKCWVDLRILGVTLFYVLKRDLHVKIHPCTVSYARYILQRNRATLYLGMFLRINHEQSQQLPTCYSINVHNVIAFVHFLSHFLFFSCFHLNWLWAVVTKALIKFVCSLLLLLVCVSFTIIVCSETATHAVAHQTINGVLLPIIGLQ